MRVLWAAIVCAVGCGPSSRDTPERTGETDPAAADAGGGNGGGGNGDDGEDGDDGPAADAAPVTGQTYVFAHSADTLYRVDPDTFQIQPVGAFGWPSGADQMTDIALDRDGTMIGVSFDRVYAVDPDTAACTSLAELDSSFNGLSFVPRPGAAGQEMLLGAAQDGSVYEVDPATGATSPRGQYGDGMGSSGDIVSVEGFGTAATVTDLWEDDDRLATVDPMTGDATVVGATGVIDIWGLGYWGDQVYGFAEDGRFVLIDRTTGAAQVMADAGVAWWGAGVTTSAPVTID